MVRTGQAVSWESNFEQFVAIRQLPDVWSSDLKKHEKNATKVKPVRMNIIISSLSIFLDSNAA